MSKTSSASVTFMVTGEFICQTARQLYWLENEPAKAYRILECLKGEGVEGLTLQQTRALLDGEAILTGDSSVGIEFVMEEDAEFKVLVAAAKERAAAPPPAPEKGSPFDSSGDFTFDESFEEVEEKVSVLMALKAKPEAPPATALRAALVKKWGGPPEFNRLLQRYGNTVKVQRTGSRLITSGMTLGASDILELAEADSTRRDLHEQIFNLFGLTHMAAEEFEDYENSQRGHDLATELAAFLDACYTDSLPKGYN